MKFSFLAPNPSALVLLFTLCSALGSLACPSATEAEVESAYGWKEGEEDALLAKPNQEVSQALLLWKAGEVVSEEEVKAFGLEKCFGSEVLSDAVFERMQGRSFPPDCTLSPNELRYLHVLHVNLAGEILLGEMVCHKDVADALVEIFRKLFDAGYPIERMQLVDDFEANDEASMRANNSSAFNFRYVKGTRTLSNHSRGRAVDINPLYNPHVTKGGKVSPSEGKKFAERSADFPYKISRDDLCCQLFLAHGFSWGGDWKSSKDYQHFEKR